MKADIKRVLISSSIVSFILCIIYLVFFRGEFISLLLGQIFGQLISSLNFIDLYLTLNRAVKKTPKKASNYTLRKYIIRYLITAITLYIAAINDSVSIISTAIGFITIKMSIIVLYSLNDKKFFKNIIKKGSE